MKITINDRRRPYSVEKFSSLIDFIGPLSIHYEKAGKSWSVPFSSGWAAGIIAADAINDGAADYAAIIDRTTGELFAEYRAI